MRHRTVPGVSHAVRKSLPVASTSASRSSSPTELRRNIGIVFQENFLFSNTVSSNIAFGHPEASRRQIEAAARIAQAHDLLYLRV